MISKAIQCKPENDNYQALANYVGAADHEDEKLLHRWHVGCQCDDYSDAIKETCATQDMNTRTTREKTYHLLVSVNPEDDVKLSCKDWQAIEAAFAEVLGLSEHQRHCGIHNNTANTHMHVAYNLIHPQTFNRHDPYGDYYKRTRLCRELEKRYGLRIDVQEDTHALTTAPVRKNDKAATVEAHTGQQSFDGYVQEHKANITGGLDSAENWQDVHSCLAHMGLEIQITANGCTFKDCHGKHRVKASSLGRAYSKHALEKRFGPFEVRRSTHLEKERYTQKPARKGADNNALWQAFQTGITERKAALAGVNEEHQSMTQTIQENLRARLNEIKYSLLLIPKHKVECCARAQLAKKDKQEKLQQGTNARRQAVRERYPYTSWAEFLQWQANKGNTDALALLQKRKDSGKPAPKPQRDESPPQRTDWQKKIYETYANPLLHHSDKHNLITFYRMRQLAEKEPLAQDFTHRIDHKGIALIRFKDGMTIRDDGKEIIFSARDEQEKSLAIAYAKLRFGKDVQVRDNRITNGTAKNKGLLHTLFGGR